MFMMNRAPITVLEVVDATVPVVARACSTFVSLTATLMLSRMMEGLKVYTLFHIGPEDMAVMMSLESGWFFRLAIGSIVNLPFSIDCLNST